MGLFFENATTEPICYLADLSPRSWIKNCIHFMNEVLELLFASFIQSKIDINKFSLSAYKTSKSTRDDYCSTLEVLKWVIHAAFFKD